MNDSRFPWLILVPKVADIKELHQLEPHTQTLVLKEIISIGKFAMSFFEGEKLNTAALGNLVPQLHIHQIVRFSNDSAWPNPVWGFEQAVPYSAQESETLIKQLQTEFNSKLDSFTPC